MNNQLFTASIDNIDRLSKFGYMKVFRKGDILQNEQSYIHDLPIVTKGTIRVMQNDEDYQEMFLYYIKPGETCIMSFLGGLQQEKSKIKAIAEEDSEILMIPMNNMDKVISEFPEWIGYVFQIYYSRFEELLDVVKELTFKSMDERLLSYLQKKKAALGSTSLPITHEEIANDMGTSRVVVSRVLKKMENKRLIELGRNKITLM